MFWLLVVIIVGLVVWKIKIKLSYWKSKGVEQDDIPKILYNILELTVKSKSFTDMVQQTYNDFPNIKFNGIYQFIKPTILVRDPDLIKQLAIKDFDHFTDRITYMPEESYWSKTLFSLTGEKWRNMRSTLSPAFTSSKMRSMFSLMSECAENFANYFIQQEESKVLELELKEVFSRYSNDVIATCAFGVNCNSMQYKDNEFYLMGKKLTDFTSIFKNIQMMFYVLFPKLAKILGISFVSPKVTNFFKHLVIDTMKLREEQNIVRPDMINLLMEARKGKLIYEESAIANETGYATVIESKIGYIKKHKFKISDDDIAAQALVFFFAGFESVSTLMCFVAYELAINFDIQEHLQEEIDETLEQNKTITYELVNKMKYLDMVISETLRKWPPNQAVDRECVIPYEMESILSNEKPLKLEKGDAIWIPIWGIHRDPKYYPNPERFDPERFSEENKHNIKASTYMPFGIGPRNCIGSRFALLETKIVFVKLLSKFSFVVNEKTPVPIVLKKTGFILSPDKGFWVGLRRR